MLKHIPLCEHDVYLFIKTFSISNPNAFGLSLTHPNLWQSEILITHSESLSKKNYVWVALITNADLSFKKVKVLIKNCILEAVDFSSW